MEWKTHVSLNFAPAQATIEQSAALMLRLMMEDTHRLAEPVTPKRTGFLRETVTKQMVSNEKGIMRWAMPYAEVQERGGRFDYKTQTYRPFLHYTTPGTGPHYVQNSLNQIMAKIPIYLEVVGLSK